MQTLTTRGSVDGWLQTHQPSKLTREACNIYQLQGKDAAGTHLFTRSCQVTYSALSKHLRLASSRIYLIASSRERVSSDDLVVS
jgi:hypothetical protein